MGLSYNPVWLLKRICAVLVVSAVFCGSALAGPYIVVNARTGKVIDEQGANKPWYPASLTKLMTAYVTFEALKAGKLNLKSPVRVSKKALAQPPSKMGFKVGTMMTVDNALKMVIVKSANDIAVALGEAVSGSHDAFVADMNAAARRLGMSRTSFANPHGLPNSRQRTTARDMAVLAIEIRRKHGKYAHYFRIPSIRHGKRVLRSYNRLLERFRGTDGMKTGFICASGFNIVASANRGGTQLVAVVLGELTAAERNERAANLLHNGFRGRGLDGKRVRAKTLAQLSPGFGLGPRPANLRQEVCNRKRKPKTKKKSAKALDDALKIAVSNGSRDNSASLVNTASATSQSYLQPRVKIAPVRVFTGGVSKTGSKTGVKGRPANVPIPALRPQVTVSRLSAVEPRAQKKYQPRKTNILPNPDRRPSR